MWACGHMGGINSCMGGTTRWIPSLGAKDDGGRLGWQWHLWRWWSRGITYHRPARTKSKNIMAIPTLFYFSFAAGLMELWWEKKNPNYLPNLCVVRFTPLKSNTKYFIHPTFLTGQIIPLIHSKVIYVPCDIQSALKLYRNNGPTEHPYSSSSSIPSPSTETRSA